MPEERIVNDEQRRGPTRIGPAYGPTHGCGGRRPRRRSSSSASCGDYAGVVAPRPRGPGARNAARARL